MKIIELTETQFKNYSKLHSSRNYFQTIEYSNLKSSLEKFKSGNKLVDFSYAFLGTKFNFLDISISLFCSIYAAIQKHTITAI